MTKEMSEMDVDTIFTQGQAIAVMLGTAAGAVLSVAFYLLPPLKRWHDGLTENWKPGVMALGVTLVTLALAAFNWTGIWVLAPTDVYGILTFVLAWFLGISANQTTYSTFVRPRKV
jgi:hypothetical protein